MKLPSSYSGHSIVRGAPRDEVLIDDMLKFLKEHDVEAYKAIIIDNCIYMQQEDKDEFDAANMLVDCITALGDIAPRGCVFAPHPRENDYGFWPRRLVEG